ETSRKAAILAAWREKFSLGEGLSTGCCAREKTRTTGQSRCGINYFEFHREKFSSRFTYSFALTIIESTYMPATAT
ncbi:hypothetical protein, partial [Acinetobacter calcoaceticus]|uniref:hypothetical protein n=1 Tax=Acinetobacter calcoaceticus TaxID=471 RepID=UPI003F7C173E